MCPPMILDPWKVSKIDDYGTVMREFGIRRIGDTLLERIRDNRLFRRHIIFGHRDLDKILDAAETGKEFAVMSGIKPTGGFHLGSKMTAEEIVFFQKMGAKAFYAIADLESYVDNGISLEKSVDIAIDNVADILALGLDPEAAYIYRQSQEKRVMSMAHLFSKGVTYNMIKAIYGQKPFGLYLSALVQVGDILLPQLSDFGGPKPVVVPVGIDQDPHIRFCRDIAQKNRDEYGFISPGSTYHRFTRSLDGSEKMSKRDPMSYITLSDNPNVARTKIMNSFTGGRPTASEQREKGGNPDVCVIYEYCVFHLIEDDDELRRMYDACKSGEIICGGCKQNVAGKLVEFLERHQRKKSEKIGLAREIVSKK